MASPMVPSTREPIGTIVVHENTTIKSSQILPLVTQPPASQMYVLKTGLRWD